jgi:hypothetical protein
MKGWRMNLAAFAAVLVTAAAVDMVLGAASARDDDDDRSAQPLGDDASWTTIFTARSGSRG